MKILVGSQNLSAHEDGLLHLHASHPDGTHLVVQVDAGEIGEATIGDGLSVGIGHQGREIASGETECSVGRAIKSRSAGGEVREEVSFVTLHGVVCRLGLFIGSGHAFVVVQCQLTALVKSKWGLCVGGERTED